MTEKLERLFSTVMPRDGFCSLRYVKEQEEALSVRQNVAEPVGRSEDVGVMITRIVGGGLGYAATSDLTRAGLERAVERATFWAQQAAQNSVVDFSSIAMPAPVGEYVGPQEVPWDSVSLTEKMDLLQTQSRRLKTDSRIVDWQVSLWHIHAEVLYITSTGGRVRQEKNQHNGNHHRDQQQAEPVSPFHRHPPLALAGRILLN